MSSYTRGYDVARVAGLFILAAIVFGLFFLYVTNRGLAMARKDVHVRISTAAGLAKSDPVFYRGVNVGEVHKLIFHDDGGVIIHAKLTQRLPLTSDAHAELVALDLFGRQSLVLKDGSSQVAPLSAADTLLGVPPASMTAKVADLGAKAERFMSDTMVALLRESLTGTAAATRQLALLGGTLQRVVAAQNQSLSRLTTNAADVAANLRMATEPQELIETRGNLQRATARLDTTSQALVGLLASLDKGEGNAGKLLRDDELYLRTNALLGSLEELVRDVKANPKRYINVKVF
jgi:phospholipid/cholesterol/gamma-HCH transport system substrate-binding protein